MKLQKLENAEERTVTIKCQRMTPDKRFEEVDVQVPAPIFDTLRFYNESGATALAAAESSKSFAGGLESCDPIRLKKSSLATKIRAIFAKK